MMMTILTVMTMVMIIMMSLYYIAVKQQTEYCNVKNLVMHQS